MNLDIRTPIGLLFLVLGALIFGFGVVTHFTNPAMYARSLDHNINIGWGLVMLGFGAAMRHYGKRATARAAEPSQTP